MIRPGYACINTAIPAPNRTCHLRHMTPKRLLALARENLTRLERILQSSALHHGVLQIQRLRPQLIFPFEEARQFLRQFTSRLEALLGGTRHTLHHHGL